MATKERTRMAVMKMEDLLNSVKGVIGEEPDDAGLDLLENITDTFSEMNRLVETSDNSSSWKNKYEDIKRKYADRFYTGSSKDDSGFSDEDREQEDRATTIRISDLFERR